MANPFAGARYPHQTGITSAGRYQPGPAGCDSGKTVEDSPTVSEAPVPLLQKCVVFNFPKDLPLFYPGCSAGRPE